MAPGWGQLFWTRLIWLDILAFAVLALIHALAWLEVMPGLSTRGHDKDRMVRSAESFRSTATGGITAVGILLPLSLVPLQIARTSSTLTVPAGATFDVFVADVWFVLSMLLGLWILWLAAARSQDEDVGKLFVITLPYGWQLFALAVGLVRFLVGMSSLLQGGSS